MKIERDLAVTIARAAVAEPYRQVDVLTTDAMANWLGQRGVRLRWETLHHFWSLGVLNPIAVLEAALPDGRDRERFVEVDVGLKERSFVDLGAEVPEDAAFAPPFLQLPQLLSGAVLWHPFQMWIFTGVHRLLRLPMAAESVLRGPEAYARLATEHVATIPRRLARFAQDPAHHEYLRVLALLLLVEPLVRPWLNLGVSLRRRPSRDDTFEGYDAWGGPRTARDCSRSRACRSISSNTGTTSSRSKRS